jgi:hypothetical protein
MVVDYFRLGRFILGPDEANAPLFVDAVAVLTLPIALELLQLVTGRHPQIFQTMDRVQEE